MRSPLRRQSPRGVPVAVTALVLGAALPASTAVASTAAAPQAPAAIAAEAAPTAPTRGHGGEVGSYPRKTRLTEPRVDSQDASLPLGLAPYHALARELNELQASSDRVSVEVIGTTVTGRELYLATLTAPETNGEGARQARMAERIRHQPAQAARDQALLRDYKAPVLVNANIHGNEWDGTDAALRLLRDYATTEDPAKVHDLEHTRIHLVLSANPDGRHGNTRRNASGFDLNRDFITGSQPETRALRAAIIQTQPLLLLDLHGYVNGTLIEPTTPPHGEAYEYDLFLKHAYRNGLAMEQAVLDLGLTVAGDGVRAPQIPFRDWDEGWDDWPPIFTPQYAAYHGAVAHTIELPLRVNNREYTSQPEEELQRRAAINTDVASAAVAASLGYVREHREQLVADQIEVFRRGVAGEPQRPVDESVAPGVGPEDVYTTEFPRGYVLPAGADQRSAQAVAALVDHLVVNDVEVVRARRPVTVAGQRYPAGSYVVDLHQAKRGMAHTILGPGSDISGRVDAMYDISGWSPGLLWGADVVTVPAGTTLKVVGEPVAAAAATGELPADQGDLRLELLDPVDVQALSSLLEAGVAVRWQDDGSVIVAATAREEAARVAEDYGASFTSAEAGGGVPLDGFSVAAAATEEELWALREMGLQVTPVDTAALNDGFAWSGVDALYVSSGLDWKDLDEQARQALDGYLDAGGGLVARGRAGVSLNDATDLLEVAAEHGRRDANGVVDVDNADSAIAAGSPEHAFVYAPTWFTELGDEVTVERRLAAEQPLVSGHWRPDSSGAGGPDQAAGEAVVVSGVDEDGARVALFGTEPLFRAHPKGQFATVARALLWSSVEE
ncbi:M14 family zinc carboxypeptidase [Ornithinicoccus halotolerans]|uniref:M14 family zinc carboxypeptidase n=1 Tax=Ornithinicoccus halotolerans TaxID=1748220 RepID=UPI0012963857|nr:M14 family zinc carboxypeptidase [Ornithinicoccus halotolerans]